MVLISYEFALETIDVALPMQTAHTLRTKRKLQIIKMNERYVDRTKQCWSMTIRSQPHIGLCSFYGNGALLTLGNERINRIHSQKSHNTQ